MSIPEPNNTICSLLNPAGAVVSPGQAVKCVPAHLHPRSIGVLSLSCPFHEGKCCWCPLLLQVCLSPLSQFFCNVGNPPDIYANMTLNAYCSLEELVAPMQHMADLHDRFRRRLVYSFGAWRAEVLDNFDVRILMREVTLDVHTDAQQAYHEYMGKVREDGAVCWEACCTSDRASMAAAVVLVAVHVADSTCCASEARHAGCVLAQQPQCWPCLGGVL